MKYIGLDGHEYATIVDLTEANKKVKEHPLYVKEMRRRAVANIPGVITREEWQRLWTSTYLEPQLKELSRIIEVAVVVPEKKSAKADKKKYSFSISPVHKSILKSANRNGIPFELTGEQIDSLLEKKCYFCRVKSETLITVGEKFDYPSSRPVCGTCKRVYDVLGDEMQDYIDRLVQG